MKRTTYAMPVYVYQETGERFHCACDYSSCRCSDDAVVDGIVVTVVTHTVHTSTVKPNGRVTFNYCADGDCAVCINNLPF